MGIYVGDTEIKGIYLGDTPIKEVYLGDTKVRPTTPPYLCFTANTAGSTVKLNKAGSPTAVTLETSTDGTNWSTYTIDSTITLSNIGDKVYWRNTSETTTGFSTATSNYYQFVMTGSISGSGDITSLINKNLATTLVGNRCFYSLFGSCTALTTAPSLPATTLTDFCYNAMFQACSNLEIAPELTATTLTQYCYAAMFGNCTKLVGLPKLPATILANYCYQNMFQRCSLIKLSTTQTGDYQTAYRIPESGTGTAGTNSLQYMFRYTGGTFTGTPTINTTYYTSNTVV